MTRLVVVGNGMAGMACVEQILKYPKQFDITVFGDETHVNYNRVMLSSVLAGEKSADDIVLNPTEWYRQHGIDLRLGVRIGGVDAQARTVTGDDGSVTPFDTLLLATGSAAWLPPIDGLDKDGVFAFRTLDDTRALMARAPGGRAVVIGGPARSALAARYAERTGRDLSKLDYYVGFNRWKSAAIVHGVYARYVEGKKSTDGIDLEEMRERIGRSLALAEQAIGRLRA
jgi:nitrite reductase (NADH) large subunit